MYKEDRIHSNLVRKYKINTIAYKGAPLILLGNTIKIQDEETGGKTSIELFINDERVSELEDIKLNSLPNDKYQSWIGILEISQKNDEEKKQVAIVQRVPRQDESDISDLKWNIFIINKLQDIHKKQFTIKERTDDFLDIRLIMSSGTRSGALMGYRSDINYVSGNPYATVLPKAFGIMGMILVFISLILLRSNHKEK